MYRVGLFVLVLSGMALFLADTGSAAAPPVNQTIGLQDVLLPSLTEAVCRGCHSLDIPNRHHALYGSGPLLPANYWYNSRSDKTPPDPIPLPDADGDGVRDAIYSCLTCHGKTDAGGNVYFELTRNCVACHQRSPHHVTADAQARHCKSCHGSVVDDFDDGHYVPVYAPSLVTPRRSEGEGLPLNSRGNGAGACNYCHDADSSVVPPTGGGTTGILNMHDLHHNDKLDTTDPVTGERRCLWCHDNLHVTGVDPPFALTLRSTTQNACENCHGPNSLHNIQADSNGDGVKVGKELLGFGHVGRDAGPGDSDCWGCHGFAMTAAAPGSGPVIPTVYETDKAAITAGASTTVVLTGAGFTNTAGSTTYNAAVRLTAADGSSVTLQPDIVADEGTLAVTIPATTVPGNYKVRALKANFTSNPVVISVVPRVAITKATSQRKTVTIRGSGFAGYAAGSVTSVTGTLSNGRTVNGTVVGWNDGKILANFDSLPSKVTVNSLYGSATSIVK